MEKLKPLIESDMDNCSLLNPGNITWRIKTKNTFPFIVRFRFEISAAFVSYT